MITLPNPNTPLYNHPLNAIEFWLRTQGCQQDRLQLHCWHLVRPTWKAEISLDTEELTVAYISTDISGKANFITRSFKYSLSRKDMEDAVFSGP
jgi:Protein of unknown function (DUF3143)